jgi:uncharacterized LabA/DUF88 family protein
MEREKMKKAKKQINKVVAEKTAPEELKKENLRKIKDILKEMEKNELIENIFNNPIKCFDLEKITKQVLKFSDEHAINKYVVLEAIKKDIDVNSAISSFLIFSSLKKNNGA